MNFACMFSSCFEHTAQARISWNCHLSGNGFFTCVIRLRDLLKEQKSSASQVEINIFYTGKYLKETNLFRKMSKTCRKVELAQFLYIASSPEFLVSSEVIQLARHAVCKSCLNFSKLVNSSYLNLVELKSLRQEKLFHKVSGNANRKICSELCHKLARENIQNFRVCFPSTGIWNKTWKTTDTLKI